MAKYVWIFLSCALILPFVWTKKDIPEDKKIKKDLRDYTDADLERLYEQWEEDEEPLEEDELPEHLRPPPKIDLSNLNPDRPEDLIKMSKKGRTLMMFVSVSGNPTQKETEEITQLWQTSLFNANYEVTRYVVSDDRVIFLLKDGSKAFEVGDFLVQQDRCAEVSFENQQFPGKGAAQGGEEDDNSAKSKKSSGNKASNDENKIKKKKTEL
ncbi:PREDICTED: LOW QUALITY PROTEIN: LDLR chaperone boca-like [Branchiostoma belcheri]|uniref:LRP chaperone MESD n=1 Tax=Branchiostoma belcheri TaxID=7741 RepID=A0A6P4ZMN9_BRABE|nr:PREDICTED: LOW QUALITY PROTEIN: LDLR chaperone boca-like [Branchiostoma belcheri]